MDKVLEKLHRLLSQSSEMITTASAMRVHYAVLITELNYVSSLLRKESIRISEGTDIPDDLTQWPGNCKQWYESFLPIQEIWSKIDIKALPDTGTPYEGVLYSKSLFEEKQESLEHILMRKVGILQNLIWEIKLMVYVPSKDRLSTIYQNYRNCYYKWRYKLDDKEFESFMLGGTHKRGMAERRLATKRKLQTEDLFRSGFLDPLCVELFGKSSDYSDNQYQEALDSLCEDKVLDKDFVMRYVVTKRFNHTEEQRLQFFSYEHILDLLEAQYNSFVDHTNIESAMEGYSKIVALKGVFDPILITSGTLAEHFMNIMREKVCRYTSNDNRSKPEEKKIENRYRWWHVRRALILSGLLDENISLAALGRALHEMDELERPAENITQILKSDPDSKHPRDDKRLHPIDKNCIMELRNILEYVSQKVAQRGNQIQPTSEAEIHRCIAL